MPKLTVRIIPMLSHSFDEDLVKQVLDEVEEYDFTEFEVEAEKEVTIILFANVDYVKTDKEADLKVFSL